MSMDPGSLMDYATDKEGDRIENTHVNKKCKQPTTNSISP